MRFAAILGEARRDVVSGTARVMVGFFTLLVIITLLGVADLLTISGLQTQATAFVDAGAATRGLGAKGQIDATVCENLSQVSTIQASGAVAAADPIRFSAMPTVAIQAYRVTPGFAGVVGVTDPIPGGVWVDQGLADVMGIKAGQHLTTSQGDALIGGVFAWPQDGRDQRLSFSMLIPQPAIGLFDECWLKAWPIVDSNDILLRSTQIVSPNGGAALIAQINKSFGINLDANQLFTTRLTRFVPIVLLIAGLALGFVLTLTRRLEYASALHAGQSKGDQLATCTLETAAWAVPATLVAIISIWTTARALSMQDIPGLMAVDVRGPLLALIGAMLGALIGCAIAREKHLFRLFKAR